MDARLFSRAEILIEQRRYKEANNVLAELLGNNPNNPHLLAMYSQVKLELEELDDAMEMINSAISALPNASYLHFIKARVFLHKEKYDDAENSLRDSIRLDPTDADSFALLANVKLSRKKYQEALDLANQALENDASHTLGLNVRSTAQLKLNDSEASFETIKGALKEDPNNAFTHTNYGWGLLEKGDHNEALKHFQEALRNNPNFELAQAGMMQALKAKYWIYRMFLKYAFFMGNLTEKYQWGVILGFYIGYRFLSNLAENNEALQPFLTPILVLLAVFAFSTWVITPISNLFLRLNPFGKHLLDKKQIVSSNFVGISLLTCLLGLLIYFVAGNTAWLLVAAFGFAMMVPFSVMFNPTKQKNALVYYAVAMAVVGVLAISNSFMSGDLFNTFTVIFLFGFIAFQWIANFMMIKQDNI